MRPCTAIRLQYGQSTSLPILPFLAPRAFAPWPKELLPRHDKQKPTRAKRAEYHAARSIRKQQHVADAHVSFATWSRITCGRHTCSKRPFSSAAILPVIREDSTSRTKSQEQRTSLDFQSSTEKRLDHFGRSAKNVNRADLHIFEAEDGGPVDDDAAQKTQGQDIAAQQWYAEMVEGGQDHSFYQSWDKLTQEMRQFRWRRLAMFHIQHTTSRQTWDFISRTLDHIKVSRDQLQEIFTLASRTALSTMSNEDESGGIAQAMFSALRIASGQDETFPCPKSTLRYLASCAPSGSLQSIYGYLRDCGVRMSPPVHLTFARRFAKQQDPIALQILERMNLRPRSRAFAPILEICALILRNAKDNLSPTKTDPATLSTIIDLGVPFEAPLFNALIQNALECDDIEAAMRIYSKFARGENPRADKSTYLMLLPNLRSPERLGWFLEVQRDIRFQGVQTVDPRVAHELMVARYRHMKRDQFRLMLGLYEVQFSLQPLQQLGIVSHNYEARRIDYARPFCGPLPLPTIFIVGLMLQAFSDCNSRQVSSMFRVYRNFVRLRNEGIPLFLALARRWTPWNIILKRLCSHQTTLKAWPQVIRDMESMPSNAEHAHIHPSTGMPWQPPKASNPRTWNIIIDGYSRRGSSREAERLLEVMARRDTEPDLFTFIPLLRAHAIRQDILGIEKTLRRIEVAGLELPMDEHSMKALEPFKDKEALAQALDDSARRKNDPYTARTADELFEPEAESFARDSVEEYPEQPRWDAFIQALDDSARRNVDALTSGHAEEIFGPEVETLVPEPMEEFQQWDAYAHDRREMEVD